MSFSGSLLLFSPGRGKREDRQTPSFFGMHRISAFEDFRCRRETRKREECCVLLES